MSNQYDGLNAGYSGPRVALPPDKYGNSASPALRVVSYIGARGTKDPDLTRHSLLVAGTNGVDGTAFLAIQLKKAWLTDEAISLAFNKGEPLPTTTAQNVATAKQFFVEDAVATLKRNNTPADQVTPALIESTYDKIMTRIRIDVGTIFRLQDWMGVERNPQVSLGTLVGADFSGEVEAGQPNKEGDPTSQVKSVYSRKQTRASA